MLYKTGDVLPGTSGLTASALNDPYTNGLGKVGFNGTVGTDRFIWYDTGVVWLNSNSVSPVLTGAEGTMGISNTGGFIYSPSADGNDAVWTQAGLLLADGDPIPSLGLFSAFNSRPRMVDSGAAFWIGGLSTTAGGSTSNRALLTTTDPANPDIQALIIGGGTYGGLTITTTASNFAFDVSGNGLHRVHVLSATGSTATDSFVHYSSTDSVIAREGFGIPGSTTELWAAFRIPSVNNCGSWAVAGDTNGAVGEDEIIAYNNQVIVREGEIYNGLQLSGTVNAVSINNRERIAFIFSASPECLLAGPAGNFAAEGRVLLRSGDQIDIDGNGSCDFIVTDFNASNTVAPGLDLADDGMVWVSVDLTDCVSGATHVAIIGLRESCPADFNNSGGAPTVQDIFDFLAAYFNNGPGADFNGSCVVSVQDIFDFLAAYFAGCA
ncbi:MAG: GC-type dockerin domain-anchored protein [Phycisphaerales bacterium]